MSNKYTKKKFGKKDIGNTNSSNNPDDYFDAIVDEYDDSEAIEKEDEFVTQILKGFNLQNANNIDDDDADDIYDNDENDRSDDSYGYNSKDNIIKITKEKKISPSKRRAKDIKEFMENMNLIINQKFYGKTEIPATNVINDIKGVIYNVKNSVEQLINATNDNLKDTLKENFKSLIDRVKDANELVKTNVQNMDKQDENIKKLYEKYIEKVRVFNQYLQDYDTIKKNMTVNM